MTNTSLFQTVIREMLSSRESARTPESDLVMDGIEAVAAFEKAGERNGILSGIYTYNLAQSCSVIGPGDRVLDLGCGPGGLLANLAEVNPDSVFVGIDLADSMIARADQRIRSAKLQNVAVQRDDMSSLRSIEDSSFDVVLSSMALHHLPDQHGLRACLAAVERVLKPMGKIYICDFGRLRSPYSIDYFVRRAIPAEEHLLARDYANSLRAAFSVSEFRGALPPRVGCRARMYSTPISPLIIVIKSTMSHPLSAPVKERINQIISELPHQRRLDLQQLKLSLRLGGLKWAMNSTV